ncbi:WD40-repeat-containing domain protein [Mycena epipterygia]|nr:WD40-repeat-containing domain protein [Mycena epipterygia]
MSSSYSLLVQTVDGVLWKPNRLLGKTPNLYVVICRDGVEIQRTRTIKGELAPKWNHLSKMLSDSPSSTISLRLFHKSRMGQDKCLGIADTDITQLLQLDGTDGNIKAVKLELTGGPSKEIPAGTLSVCLMRDDEAAAVALVKTGIISQSVSKVEQLQSALSLVTSRLQSIVRIGDQVATIHPYANIAWRVLTSVYQAIKTQQETDDKLIKLVQTIGEVYSFVEDTNLLPQKLRSLENQASAIVKQTVECALFIQEYSANGFCARTAQNAWVGADQKIDDLSAKLRDLRDSFDRRLTIQGLFLSTKILEKLDGLEQSDILRKLNPVDMNATSRPLCLSGTRREILDDITEWVAVPSDSGNILWLSGVAGSGKSTISTTVSESFRALDRLGAFLFFDRNDRSRSHPDAVIRTIAYSLALSNPPIRVAIAAAIQRDPGVVNAPIWTQFNALLLDPLRLAEHHIHGPILIVLDALDECGDRHSRAALLSVLSEGFPKLPHLFRVLITSRREMDIADQFKSLAGWKNLDCMLTSTQDVELFIRHETAYIRELRSLDLTWPGEENIQALTNLSGGLFIWASTAIRFIDDYRPDRQLEILVTQNPSHQGFNLDGLYAMALRNSGPWDTNKQFTEDARAVLACVVLGRVPMTNRTIDRLLYSGKTHSGGVLKYLGCVVQWTPGSEARILHASFADYLTDPNRSGGEPWSLDPKVEHRSISLGCLRILNTELQFNICDLEDSHSLNVDVPDMVARVTEMVSPQLMYSSCFWFHHIQDTPFDKIILEAVKTLMQHKLLFWLEVLSLLRRIPSTTTALRVAVDFVKGHDKDLEDLIVDIIKFVDTFSPMFAQSVPHIYLSALPFAPRGSRVAKQFTASFPHILQVQGPLEHHWPRMQKVLRGHTKQVNSVSFSPRGTCLASGSDDRTVCIWDAQTGALIAGPLKGHTDQVNSVSFSPDGMRIASGSNDHTVRVWDARTGVPLLVSVQGGTTNWITCVDFSPDGRHIAAGGTDNTVRVLDAKTGAHVTGLFEHHIRWVSSISFSPDSTQIASGSWDNILYIWDVQTCALVAKPCKGHTDLVKSVSFSPDATRIASGSNDHTVRVWDTRTGLLVSGPLEGHCGFVTSVHFSPDNIRIVSGSYDKTVCIWDSCTGVLVAGPLEGHTRPVTSVKFSPEGGQVISGSYDKTVRIWDTQTGAAVHVIGQLDGHTHRVSSISFSPDSKQIASGSSDNGVRIWDAQTGALVAGPFDGHTERVRSVHFSPDGLHIASGAYDKTVCVWDAQTGALVTGPIAGHTRSVTSVHFAPDGLRIASGSYDHTVRVWDAHTGSLVAGPFQGHTRLVTTVHFSPDGKQIISGSYDKTVRIWNAQTGALLGVPLQGHTDWVSSVCFSPDGTRIASGSYDKTVRIWDSHTGAPVTGPLEGHTRPVTSLNFSPGGARIVSGAYDMTVCVWDAQTGSLVVGPLYGHTDRITSIDFSPDGTQFASGSGDYTVRLWDAEPGIIARSLEGKTNSLPVAPLKLQADISTDSMVRVLQVRRGRTLQTQNLMTMFLNQGSKNPLGAQPRLSDGWVLNSAGEFMFWVPPWCRDGLYLPQNRLVICRTGTTKLDLTQFVHGTEWQKCIDRRFRVTKRILGSAQI